MTLPSWMFKDPSEVFEQTESRTCKGCMWEKSAKLLGKVHTVCTKLLPGGKRREHGKRCSNYDDGEG
jgi:hypothetical protein